MADQVRVKNAPGACRVDLLRRAMPQRYREFFLPVAGGVGGDDNYL